MWDKVFERVISSQVFEFVGEIKSVTPKQYVFLLDKSFQNQNLYIVSNSNAGFRNNSSIERKGKFLDIQKTFDRA